MRWRTLYWNPMSSIVILSIILMCFSRSLLKLFERPPRLQLIIFFCRFYSFSLSYSGSLMISLSSIMLSIETFSWLNSSSDATEANLTTLERSELQDSDTAALASHSLLITMLTGWSFSGFYCCYYWTPSLLLSGVVTKTMPCSSEVSVYLTIEPFYDVKRFLIRLGCMNSKEFLNESC